VAGGIRITEVGVELPLALALYSARTNAALPANTAVIGEVSLTGEVRPVPGMEKRLRACRDLGYATLVGPAEDVERPEDPSLVAVQLIKDAVRSVFGGK
jgi:DNA repair protein RadA/Sms